MQPVRLGHLLGHPGDEEGVLTAGRVRSVVLGRADREDDEIVLPEALLDLVPGHVLQVDARRPVHVTPLGGQRPLHGVLPCPHPATPAPISVSVRSR